MAELRHLLLACALLAPGCGGAPVPTRGGEELRAEIDVATGELPPVKRGFLWGDGFGPTAHEAVLDARRAVSEQITAQVRSETRAHESETNGVADRRAEVRTRSTTTFDHAELFKTRGLVERPGGFAARVVLDPAEAIAVYRAELDADAQRLAKLGPVLEAAITEGDTSVLLSAAHSPGQVLRDIARRRQIIQRLGGRADLPEGAKAAAELERRAAQARAQVLIRLSIDGADNEAMRRATAEAVGEVMAARGCRMTTDAAAGATTGPLVEALLVVHLRDHEEHGLLWRYLGVELRMVDGPTGKALFEFIRTPAYVHGGGPSWDQADRATARRLKERLSEDAAEFDGLVCR